MAVALVTAAVSLVPMACGGEEAAMRATLTNDGCTYDGDTSPTAGMFTIEVENQTEFSGSFVLLSLAEGSTVDDLQPALDQYPRQFERDGTLPKPPDYKFLVRSDVEAGATSALPADVSAGTYAVVCFVDDVSHRAGLHRGAADRDEYRAACQAPGHTPRCGRSTQQPHAVEATRLPGLHARDRHGARRLHPVRSGAPPAGGTIAR